MASRAADHASLDHPYAAAMLLEALRAAGTDDAVATLASRAADHASLDDPLAVAGLLRALCKAGADAAVHALLARDPVGHARLNADSQGATMLLEALREAGADAAVHALATRAANMGMFDLILKVRPENSSTYVFGREPDETPSQSWNWQEPASRN